MERSRRDLEIVRQTAELLASGRALSETFEELCHLLARFVTGELAFIVIVADGEPYLEFAYDDGKMLRDAHIPVGEGSQTRVVLKSGKSLRVGGTNELNVPTVPFRVPGGRNQNTESAIFVPLRVGQEMLGVLSLQSHRRNAYTDEDTLLLETCALYVAVAVQADRATRLAQTQVNEFAIDAVTGVFTRRAFNECLADDWARGRRDGTLISLLMLDIDQFKPFNDTYGHLAGDACLRQVAQTARALITRESDTFARYGGEEFAAILWSTDVDGARAIAERIREAVYELKIQHLSSGRGRVTVSIGVACAAPMGSEPDALIAAADRALYSAKENGRDRVTISTEVA